MIKHIICIDFVELSLKQITFKLDLLLLKHDVAKPLGNTCYTEYPSATKLFDVVSYSYGWGIT